MSNCSNQQLPDDRLEALGRLERRRLLLELSATDRRDGASLDFGEMDGTAGELDAFVALQHVHLPVLEERGFVRWDREHHRVTKGPRFDELEPFLQLLRELQDDLPERWI